MAAFEDDVRNAHTVARIRQFLALQLLLVVTLTHRAVEAPSLAFYERKLQPNKEAVARIQQDIHQASHSCDATVNNLRLQVHELQLSLMRARSQ